MFATEHFHRHRHQHAAHFAQSLLEEAHARHQRGPCEGWDIEKRSIRSGPLSRLTKALPLASVSNVFDRGDLAAGDWPLRSISLDRVKARLREGQFHA